jgi:hypothetical protein
VRFASPRTFRTASVKTGRTACLRTSDAQRDAHRVRRQDHRVTTSVASV